MNYTPVESESGIIYVGLPGSEAATKLRGTAQYAPSPPKSVHVSLDTVHVSENHYWLRSALNYHGNLSAIVQIGNVMILGQTRVILHSHPIMHPGNSVVVLPVMKLQFIPEFHKTWIFPLRDRANRSLYNTMLKDWRLTAEDLCCI
jgi:hypothetical protein